MPAEVIETIFEVIEGGASVEGATIIEFPTDVVVGETLTGTTTELTLGNGIATEVSQLTVETAAGVTETAGVGLLAVDVGVAGAAAAPILGILAGVGLYNLAPEFWTSVADKLWEAGETVGGKVRAFLNPKTKQVGLSQTTLEIFKKAFLEAGIFNTEYKLQEDIYYSQNSKYFGSANSAITESVPSSEIVGIMETFNFAKPYFFNELLELTATSSNQYSKSKLIVLNNIEYYLSLAIQYNNGGLALLNFLLPDKPNVLNNVPFYLVFLTEPKFKFYFSGSDLCYICSATGKGIQIRFDILSSPLNPSQWPNAILIETLTTGYLLYMITFDVSSGSSWGYFQANLVNDKKYFNIQGITIVNLGIKGLNENLQPDATYPTADLTIPETYPNYIPWELPETLPLPSIYPIEIPVVNPNPSQEQAQNPEPLPDNQPVADWLIDNLPQPDPVPNPPSDGGETEPPDPPDPNPDPEPGPLPVIPVMPDTVNAHKMFTVYNPTLSQLNDFGGWLWTSDIIDNIVKIWAGDPIQGILSLRKVYAKPVTGSMKNIVVGYLDSGVDALEVSNQFVTIECGTVQVAEQKHNATDYPPYTSLHLYLPFIGVVELDPNEFMNGSITVTYHVDVYTGSCLAEVKATRSADMPNATILYTFTGNASQELPLSSSNFSGAISSLVSLATAGIAVASGGGLIAAGATASAIHSLTHEMIHINRSGNLSSNAGIMGSRIPYLIIGMRHGYDANAYNELYGYPANKTVYIGNCKGYTRVKAGRLRTKATEAEKKEIMQLLEKGVIL